MIRIGLFIFSSTPYRVKQNILNHEVQIKNVPAFLTMTSSLNRNFSTWESFLNLFKFGENIDVGGDVLDIGKIKF